ncbi:hypothetical protein HDU98_006674 [Podochytrium sp. JEL0797]|nr:hypothetical protein HDU98_006674 [Podochytrium sp. JEL0797]
MPQIDEYKKNIGFQGGLTIPLIPALFQSAGWLFPVLIFIIIGWLSGMACLFLIESMTYFPGNRYFERNVEFTVLVHHFYGKRWYYLMHVILYGSLQSFNISSIISAVQSFDVFILSVFGQTCGFRVFPIQDIHCVDSSTAATGTGSPFGTDYMLITAGGLLFGCFIAPLMNLNLDDNMIVQWISLVYIGFVVFCWVIMMFIAGVDTSLMPTVGAQFATAPTSVIGQVMFNFTFANTIPSWMNTKHNKVSIHKCIWTAVIVSASLYIVTGVAGALSFTLPSGSNLMAVQTAYFAIHGSSTIQGLVNFITLTFPILCLITSIPVAFIIIKLNLITSRLCSKDTAGFFGSILPFLICVPFQTGPFMVSFTNWSSLFFQSMCNFMAPFLIYIFLDQRNTVMAQSVIDELENLDLDGAIKKKSSEDDDFDYVYHLPHADLSRLPPRKYDPFAQFAIQETTKEGKQLQLDAKRPTAGGIPIPIIAGSVTGSKSSLTSAQGKTVAKLLSLGADAQPDPLKKRIHQHHKSSLERLSGAGSQLGLLGGGGGLHAHGAGGRRSSALAPAGGASRMNLGGGSRMNLGGGGGSRMDLGGRESHEVSLRTSTAGRGGEGSMWSSTAGNSQHTVLEAEMRRRSMGTKRISPMYGGSGGGSLDTVGFNHPEKSSKSMLIDGMSYLGSSVGDSTYFEDDFNSGPPSFKTLPEWVTKYVSSRTVAIMCFVFITTLTVAVLMYDFVMLGYGVDVVDGITFGSGVAGGKMDWFTFAFVVGLSIVVC